MQGSDHAPDLKTVRIKSNPETKRQFDEADCTCGDRTEIWFRAWPNGKWNKQRINP